MTPWPSPKMLAGFRSAAYAEVCIVVTGLKLVHALFDAVFWYGQDPQQRYFTQEQLGKIIDAAPGQYGTLFALLAGTGMRIGEAAGLHVDDLDLDNCVISVRRGVFEGQEQTTKSKRGKRDIDIDVGLAGLLRRHLDGRRAGRVFEARNGSPLRGNNIRKRVLQPLLQRLGIPKAGLHAFRHSRVTMLRKNGTPADLQLQWIGHSCLRTTDRYSHTDKELEYRRNAASKVGLNLLVGPNGPKSTVGISSVSA